MATRTTTVRLHEELSDKLDALAVALDRPRAWVLEQAVQNYVDEQSWQVEAVKSALDDYSSGKAELVPHEQVMARLESRIRQELDQ